jgi:hypothetical protein
MFEKVEEKNNFRSGLPVSVHVKAATAVAKDCGPKRQKGL